MILQQQNNLTFLSSPLLSAYPEISHGFSTRLGGISAGPYASLNLSLSTGDSSESVTENRRRWFAALGVAENSVTIPRQVLESDIHVGPPFPDTPADGIITASPGQALLTQSADCVLILLYDPVKKVAGNLHASWKGALGEIVHKGVTLMRDRFKTAPSDIRAAIGPAIGPCCYEVRDDVIQPFRQRHRYAEQYMYQRQGKTYLDLWGLNKRQLIESGVTIDHIDLASLCTRCHPEWFYSYRRDGPRPDEFGRGSPPAARTGRFSAVIGLT